MFVITTLVLPDFELDEFYLIISFVTVGYRFIAVNRITNMEMIQTTLNTERCRTAFIIDPVDKYRDLFATRERKDNKDFSIWFYVRNCFSMVWPNLPC